jgi:hypothetical protein
MAEGLQDLVRELFALPEGHPLRMAGELLIETELRRMRREERLRAWEQKERGYTR